MPEVILLALRVGGALLTTAAVTVTAFCLSRLPATLDLTIAVAAAATWTHWLDGHDSW